MQNKLIYKYFVVICTRIQRKRLPKRFKGSRRELKTFCVVMKKFVYVAVMALAMTACGGSTTTTTTNENAIIIDSIATEVVPAAATEVLPAAAPGDSGKVATEVIPAEPAK